MFDNLFALGIIVIVAIFLGVVIWQGLATYRIKIEDKATIHNFRLRGPGVNKATSVPGKTETIWTVRLRTGTYRFLCDPHAASMRGSFRVT